MQLFPYKVLISDSTLRKVDQKYVESFEVWCWRRMEISWNDRVENEILHTLKEERNILYVIKRRKTNCFGHILHRSCLLKHVTVGKIEGRIYVTGRRGRRLSSYWMPLRKRKEEALDRHLCRTRCRRSYGPVVRQT